MRILNRERLDEIAGGSYGVPEREYDRLTGSPIRRPVRSGLTAARTPLGGAVAGILKLANDLAQGNPPIWKAQTEEQTESLRRF